MATCCDRNNDWIHSCATKVIVYHLITYLHELKTFITDKTFKEAENATQLPQL